jgi:uncharacterized integral membrane protein
LPGTCPAKAEKKSAPCGRFFHFRQPDAQRGAQDLRSRGNASFTIRVDSVRRRGVARRGKPQQREGFMKFIVWLIRVLVFVLLLVLALANTQTATLNFVAGYAWQAPLILIGLAFFAVGLLAGLLSALPSIFRLRIENGRLKRDLRAARETPAVIDQPPMPPVI